MEPLTNAAASSRRPMFPVLCSSKKWPIAESPSTTPPKSFSRQRKSAELRQLASILREAAVFCHPVRLLRPSHCYINKLFARSRKKATGDGGLLLFLKPELELRHLLHCFI